MSTDTKMEVSFWEKLSDGFSAFGEAFSQFLTRIFGSSNQRYVRKLGYIRPARPGAEHTVTPGSTLAHITSLEPAMQAHTDEELRGSPAKPRARLEQGATLDDLLPEAFAACREAAKRTKNMRHFDVQML